jgi:hypothetical protein
MSYYSPRCSQCISSSHVHRFTPLYSYNSLLHPFVLAGMAGSWQTEISALVTLPMGNHHSIPRYGHHPMAA